MCQMFLFSLVRSTLQKRHENLITALNKEHASRELLSFKKLIYEGKCGYSENERV